MDLIDRYLDTIRVLLLPAAQRDDIVAELRDVLTGRREDKVAELGRPLTRAEDEALLRDFGHPLVVAARYGPQRYLIGPELYPFYAFVLKLVLVTLCVVAIIVGLCEGVFAGASPLRAAGEGLGVLRVGGFAAVGVVTVVFAILQRRDVRVKLFEDWNPRDLPRIGRRRRAAWYDHVAGIVVQVIFLFWWLGLVRPWTSAWPVKGGGALHIDFAPVWAQIYWPVAALAVGVIVVNCLKLMVPGRRRFAYGLDIAVQVATAAIAALALNAGHWANVAGQGVSATTLAAVDRGVNLGLHITLVIMICASAAAILHDAWRLWRPEGLGAKGALNA